MKKSNLHGSRLKSLKKIFILIIKILFQMNRQKKLKSLRIFGKPVFKFNNLQTRKQNIFF